MTSLMISLTADIAVDVADVADVADSTVVIIVFSTAAGIIIVTGGADTYSSCSIVTDDRNGYYCI